MFNCLMASLAENERLSRKCNHPLDPCRLWPSRVFMELSHGLYMMDFYLPVTPTEFAELCQESLHKFCAIAIGFRRVVLYGCLGIPRERSCAPGCYQWGLLFSWHAGLESLILLAPDHQLRSIFLVDFCHRHLELVCQCLGQ